MHMSLAINSLVKVLKKFGLKSTDNFFMSYYYVGQNGTYAINSTTKGLFINGHKVSMNKTLVINLNAGDRIDQFGLMRVKSI